MVIDMFFYSTRGLKQGGPLSPALFILGAEVLTRMLNNIYDNPIYKGFYMKPKGPQINHLCFADDVIIFTSTNRDSLQIVMNILADYEQVSQQLINKQKNYFMVPNNILKISFLIFIGLLVFPRKIVLLYI